MKETKKGTDSSCHKFAAIKKQIIRLGDRQIGSRKSIRDRREMAAMFNASIGSGQNGHAGECVLGRLQAENTELRNTAVGLALEIQELRQRVDH
jgi:hypothetical protein